MWLISTVATVAAVGAYTGNRYRAKGFDKIARSNLIFTFGVVAQATATNTAADKIVAQHIGLGGVVTLLAGLSLTYWATGVIIRHEDLCDYETVLPRLVANLGTYGIIIWWLLEGARGTPPTHLDLVAVLSFDFVLIAAFLRVMVTGTYLARDWNGPPRLVGHVYVITGLAAAALMSFDLLFAWTGNIYLTRWIPGIHVLLYLAPIAFTWVAQRNPYRPSTPSYRRRLTFSLADGLGFTPHDYRPPQPSGRSGLPDSTVG